MEIGLEMVGFLLVVVSYLVGFYVELPKAYDAKNLCFFWHPSPLFRFGKI